MEDLKMKTSHMKFTLIHNLGGTSVCLWETCKILAPAVELVIIHESSLEVI